jgi:undecaprenyldiphospho-muramoylpentapeptide beta-N-acetylglucosaminyltransferase
MVAPGATGAGVPAVHAVIAGGGTAGHVLPGLAIGRALVERGHAAGSIRFVGSERGIEARLVPEAGFPLTVLPGRGIRRSLSPANVGAVLGILAAVVRALVLVRRWRPRVVVVLGGYASVPCAIAALVWRVPVVVAEQNARAGAANRLAARWARACAVPFEDTDLPRAVVTGNPVRDEILAVDRARDAGATRQRLGLPADRTVVAVFSGSLGSRRINEAVEALAARWADRADLAVHHVVGRRDADELERRRPEPPPDGLWYRQVPYQDDMASLLAAADVAVCRAGGTTVAELAQVALPAVLVPLPIATRDHQRANAGPLVAAGAAVLVADDELDVDRLERELGPLVDDPARLVAMAAAAGALARPDAADAVAALVEEHARP